MSGTERHAPEAEPLTSFQRGRAASWRSGEPICWEFAEADPLACPNCSSEMKVIAFILDPPVIRRILDHLRGLARDPPRHASGPPVH